MFKAGDGAGRDARSAFQILGRNAGQRRAPDLITGCFPCLPRHAQHGALSRPGMAYDDAQIAPVRDMRQRVGLLTGQDEAALFGIGQSGLAVPVIQLMAFPSGHRFRRAVQALFRLDHLPGGEAVLAALVLPKFDEIRRIVYRIQDVVELVDPLAMPVREFGHVAPREGRLLMRDRVQRQIWVRDDPCAIAARDLAVHVCTIGRFYSVTLDTLRRSTDLALRLQCDALCLKTAMIDARVNIEFGQPLIGKFGPAFTPALDHLRAVPVAHLPAKAAFVPTYLYLAHGQHDMGMGFWHAVFCHIPMHIEIRDHAPIHEFAPNEVAG
jgi:hypothetical protein